MTQPTDNGAVAAQIQVRIGELALSGDVGPCLVTVGLGSCVGVAVIDPEHGTVALAHVFLPEPPPAGAKPTAGVATYATTAIPHLINEVLDRGSDRSTRRLVAVIIGGARMFAGRSGIDIGNRNLEAVRAGLNLAGVRIVAEEVGGTQGRTVRVVPGPAACVGVRTVGQCEHVIWSRQSGGASIQDMSGHVAV